MLFAVKGKSPELGESVFVAETAAVVGDVRLDAGASVWFGASVRADMGRIIIGGKSNIQDNATLHTRPGCVLRIGKNVTVGHNAVVHCAEVGDNCLIGMGAVLLDGAVIGSDCVVGAGAVVTQNTVVPDGTMMLGVPAKSVKRLDEDTVALLRQENHYVALAREYLE